MMTMVVVEEKERYSLVFCIYLSEQKGITGEEVVRLLLFILISTLPTPSYTFLFTFKSSQIRGEESAKEENKRAILQRGQRSTRATDDAYHTEQAFNTIPFLHSKVSFQMSTR